VLNNFIFLKAKKKGVKDDNVREQLSAFTVSNISEPASVEIFGQTLAGNIQGSKLVYVKNTENGKRYSSVEEEAICHYRNQGGYSRGKLISFPSFFSTGMSYLHNQTQHKN